MRTVFAFLNGLREHRHEFATGYTSSRTLDRAYNHGRAFGIILSSIVIRR